MNNSGGALSFDAIINDEQFRRSIMDMERRIRSLSGVASSEAQKTDDSFKRLGYAIGAYLTFDSLKTLGSELIKVRGEFQSLETAFTTMLGSKERANALMGQISQLAAATPYGLNDIATSTKMLMSYGTEAQNSVSTIRMLGDVASGVSAPLKDIVYLYGTLQSQGRAYAVDIRQFAGRGIPIYKELANVLNVSVGEVNGLVEAGKVGFPQVEQAFKNMTSAGGMFYNSMDAQSKTIQGLTSTLRDNIDMMFNNIGKNQEGFIAGTIKLGISATQNYEKIVDVLGVLVATYGAYKTAVILATAVESASIAVKSGWTIAQLAQYRALLLAEGAQRALNATMLANPYVLAGTLLVGLAASIYVMSKNTDAATMAQESLAKSTEKANEAMSGELAKIDMLKSQIASESLSRETRNQKLKELVAISPEHFNALTLESIGTRDGKKAIDDYIQSKTKQIQLQQLEADLQESIKRKIDLQQDKGAFGAGGVKGYALSIIDNALGTRTYEENKKKQIKAEDDFQASLKKTVIELTKSNQAQKSATNNAPVVKNKQWYEEQIKSLEGLQSKYEVGSKKYIELEGQIKKLRDTLNPKSASKVDEVAPYGSIRYWEKVAQKAKEAADIAQSSASRAKAKAEILKAESEANKLKKELSVKSFEEELQEKKKQYELYQQWIEYVSQDSANKQFESLLKSGKTYEDYLNSQIKTLSDQAKSGTLSEEGAKKLGSLASELDSLKTGKSRIEEFKKSLDETSKSTVKLTDYLEYLKTLQSQLSGDNSQLGEQKRVEVATKIAETQRKINEDLQQFLENSSNYEQQILNIQKKYSILRDENEAQYSDKRNADYLKNKELINIEEQKELESIKKYQIQHLDSYKKLQETLYNSNREGLKARLKDEEQLLKDIKIKYGEQSDEYKRLMKEIEQTKKEIDKSLIDTVNSFAGLASGLGQALQQIGGGFGQVGSMLSGLASSSRAITVGFDKSASTTERLSAGISGIISLTNMVISAANQRNAKEKEYQQNAIAFEHEYKILLNERLGTQAQLDENVFVKDYQGRLSDSFKMFSDASSKYKQALAELSKGQAKIGLQNQLNLGNIGTAVGSGAALGAAVGSIVPGLGTAIGAAVGAGVGAIVGIFAGKTKEDTYGELLKLYPDLIKEASNGQKVFNKDLANTLINTGQVDDSTKQLLQNTLDWVAQMEKAKETVKTVIQELAGNLGNTLRDNLVNAFKEGTSAAEAFGQSVSSILEDLLSQIIFNQVFSDAFDKLQEQLSNSQNILGGENSWLDAFGQFFQQADGLWQQFYDGLQAAQASADKYGLKIFGNSSSSSNNSLTGAVKSITTEQASLLAGQFNAIRINTAAQLSIAKEGITYLQQMSVNVATYLPYLEGIDSKLAKLSSDSLLRSKGLGG